MRILFGSLLLLVSVVGTSRSEAQRRVRAPDAPIVRLVARDYSFETPVRLASGIVRVRLVNRGSEPHYASFYRLAAGKTAKDFLTWRSSRQAAPDWLTFISGPAPVVPGDSSDLTMRLPPGHYIIICGYPGRDGLQHIDKGMFRVLDTEPPRNGPARAAAFPNVTRKFSLTGSGFHLNRPIPAGWRAIGIENRGSTAEQALIVRIPAGVEIADEQRWFDENFRRARPGLPWGGALLVAPGERYIVTRNFVPGRYAILSHLAGKWQILPFVVRR